MSYFDANERYPFGIDLSVYNLSAERGAYPNFDRIAAHVPKVEFIAMRAGQSTGYHDPAFPTFLREATRIGVCVLPYHVIYPGVSATEQMGAFLRILGGADLSRLRLVLDVELVHNQSRAVITATLLACLQMLRAETGRYPIVYSRALWVDEHLTLGALPQVDWWLAQYYYRREPPAYTPEYPCPPLLPKGLTRWLIHQTSERGPAIGGVGDYMDYDRWNGSSANLRAYFGMAETQTELICPLDGQACPVASQKREAAGKKSPGPRKRVEVIA